MNVFIVFFYKPGLIEYEQEKNSECAYVCHLIFFALILFLMIRSFYTVL